MAAIAMVLTPLAMSQSAFAIGESLGSAGPANSGVGYVVSNRKTQVKIFTSTVGLYFNENTSTKTVTIANGDLCAVTPPSTGAFGDRWNSIDAYTEDIFNDFKIVRVDADENEISTPASYPAVHLFASTNPDATDCQIKFNLPNSYLTRSTNNGKYMVLLRAQVRPNTPNDTQNTFRVILSSGYVAALGVNTSVESTARLKQVGYNDIPAGLRSGTYIDHSIPFGSPCFIASPTTARISFFDTDNGVAVIQPEPFRVRILDVTTSTTVNASGGFGFNTVDPDGTPYSGGVRFYSPPSGSQTYSWLDYSAQPGHKYRLDIYHQHNVNTLQVTMPFDSIYSAVNCGSIVPELDPIVTLDPAGGGSTVGIGESINGGFEVAETNRFNDGVADYSRRFWVENGNDSTFGAGDVIIPGSCTAAGTNYTFAAGGSTSVNCNYTVTGGNAICGMYFLTPKNTPNGMTTVIAPNPEVVCVPIAKSPKIQVNGGDVWVGGKLVSPCTVTPANARIVGVDDAAGDKNASFGDLAVTALGTISDFGSNSQAYSNGVGKNLTFAYTPSTGTFMGATPSHCLSDPFTAFASIPKTIGGVTLGATALGAGGKLYRYYSGDIVINGNITYADTPYAFGQFPQTVIMTDGNIIVNPGVTQLDGLYIAKGQIRTCNAAPLNANQCATGLTINGAAFTGTNLKPWRTFGAEGAGAAINNKAEVINLRPDLYYSECQRVCSNGIQTVSEQEAPVRF
jgi:hypothetical protein